MEWLLSLIGSIISIVISISSLAYWLGRKFAEIDLRFKQIDDGFRQVDERFKQIDERFRQIDKKFEQIDKGFKEIDEHFKQIDKRFERLELRIDGLERRFEEFEKQVNVKFKEIDERFNKISSDIKRAFSHVVSFTQSAQCTLIDFMSMKGLFTKEEREFLVKDIERIGKAHLATLNPLKPEEARFILEVVKEIKEKDPKEIDLSKLDKIIEIAKRWFFEDGHPDAARLMIEAYMLKAILRKERGEY